MRRTAWAIVATAVLLLAGFAALGSGLSFSTAPAASAAPSGGLRAAATTVAICSTDVDDFCETEYGVGPTPVAYLPGYIYFRATDPSDDQAVVQINDYNASRDHLTNPVASWTVNTTSGENVSSDYGRYYAIPFGLLYGGTWNITISGAVGGFASENFTVHTFRVNADEAQSVVLPGASVPVYYYVAAAVNDSPYSAPFNLSYDTSWTVAGVVTHGSIVTVSHPTNAGSFPVSIPGNAEVGTAFDLTLWAQTRNGTQVIENESTAVAIDVGELRFDSVRLCAYPEGPFGCDAADFVTNSTVFGSAALELYYPATGETVPAQGISVGISFHNGAAVVTPLGSPPATVVSNASGEIAFSFQATGTAFSTTAGRNAVNLSAVAPVNGTLVSNRAYDNVTFEIYSTTPSTYLTLAFNAGQYFGGDTATLTWSVASANVTATGPYSVRVWEEIYLTNDSLAGIGNITSTASSGTFTVPIPLNYTGEIEVLVVATNATNSADAEAVAYVSPPQLSLEASPSTYVPGNTITVSVTTEGSVFSGATLWYRALDDRDTVVASGTVSNDAVSFTVPSSAASTSYEFLVWAQAPGLGMFAQGTVEATELDSYSVFAGIVTPSSYADGSYQPGQTIQVSYHLVALGIAPAASALAVTAYFDSVEVRAFTAHASSGTFSFTIPSYTPSGSQALVVDAAPTAPGCLLGCSYSTTVGVNVQASPSALSYELGAGSGFTVGLLVLLIVVLVVGSLVYFALRRRQPPATMVMSPSGGTGSPPAGSPPEWKESSPPSSPTPPASDSSGGSTPPASPPAGSS